MKILVLANVPPGSIGGAEVQARHLAEQWAASGHHVLVAGPKNKPSRSNGLRILRVPIFKYSKPGRSVSYVLCIMHLTWRLRHEYDLIYCRFLTEQALAASISKKLLGFRKPIVATPAGTSMYGDAAYLSRLPLSALWIRVLRESLNGINAMTPAIEREVCEIGLGSQIVSRIPNGTRIPSAYATKGWGGRNLRVVYVGRLTYEKGIDTLIQAALQINGTENAIEYRIAGDGPLRRSLELSCASLEIASRFEFLGSLTSQSVSEQLNWANLFVLPSRSEGMPGALLEAIAHGLPVVATTVSGSNDIVRPEFGWLVPPDNPAALAEALITAANLDRSRLREMGHRARVQALRRYNIADIADDYLRLFRALTDEETVATGN